MPAPIADAKVDRRCAQLRDGGMTLGEIAGLLLDEFPDLFTKVPSPQSVLNWANRGAQTWAHQYGADEDELLNVAIVRRRKARRLQSWMGVLYLAVQQGDPDRVTWLAKAVNAQALLEREEAKLVGTDAPKVIHQQIQGLHAALHDGTAAAIAATVEPAAPPPARPGG